MCSKKKIKSSMNFAYHFCKRFYDRILIKKIENNSMKMQENLQDTICISMFIRCLTINSINRLLIFLINSVRYCRSEQEWIICIWHSSSYLSVCSGLLYGVRISSYCFKKFWISAAELNIKTSRIDSPLIKSFLNCLYTMVSKLVWIKRRFI